MLFQLKFSKNNELSLKSHGPYANAIKYVEDSIFL